MPDADLKDIKQKYKALMAECDAAWASAEPQRRAYYEALEPFYQMDAQVDALLADVGGDVHGRCEGCAEPVFDSESYANIRDGGILCLDCAPTHRDLKEHPDYFLNTDDVPMSQAEADAICGAHIAAGGRLDDKKVIRNG